MSAKWNIHSNIIFFVSDYFGLKSSYITQVFKTSNFLKWFDISVARIESIIIFLTFLNWSLSSLSNMLYLFSSFVIISKVVATWWFSRTDTSLYLILRACLDSTKYKLFKPGWSTSWQAAAIVNDIISHLSIPQIYIRSPCEQKW